MKSVALKKPTLNVVRWTGLPIFQQLQYEEALLRTDKENWCFLNQGSPPAIVLGISGKLSQLVNLKKIQEQPIPLVRRFSGGGTVVVDETTFFVTFIMQSDTLGIPPFPRQIMQWTADALYVPLLAPLPVALQENDYTLDEKKWGGNAQSIIRGRWLHHSSLLWDYQESYMDYLFVPERAPLYRSKRSHSDFLCRLREFWPFKETLAEKIEDQLETLFILQKKPLSEVLDRIHLPHRKTTHILTPSIELLWEGGGLQKKEEVIC